MTNPGQQYEPWPPQEPAPPEDDRRWPILLAAGLVGLCLVAACAAAAFFLLRPLLSLPEPSTPPAIPTLPGVAQTATAAAEAGATTTLEQSATPDLQETPLPAATATVVEESVEGVRAGFVAQAPTVDGSAEEWPAGSPVESVYRVHAVEDWDGSSDLQAEWRLAWTDAALYVVVVVADDVHVQTQTGTQIFRGDSVEMQIDTEPGADAGSVNPATYQIVLSPGDFAGLPPAAVRFRGASDGSIPQAPGHSIQVAAQQTPQGYVLEAEIPWQDLNVTPAPGMVLGLALNANDNDTPGTARQEIMMSNAPNRTLTDPSTWGTLTLE